MAQTETGQRLVTALESWLREHLFSRASADGSGALRTGTHRDRRPPAFAFWTKDRVRPLASGYQAMVPDMVLEVVLPDDSLADLFGQAGTWLEAGVKLVWVLWPEQRRLNTYRAASDVNVLEASDTLTCEALLPGFALPLSTIYG